MNAETNYGIELKYLFNISLFIRSKMYFIMTFHRQQHFSRKSVLLRNAMKMFCNLPLGNRTPLPMMQFEVGVVPHTCCCWIASMKWSVINSWVDFAAVFSACVFSHHGVGAGRRAAGFNPATPAGERLPRGRRAAGATRHSGENLLRVLLF